MSHAFISYVRKNQKKVDTLCSELKRFGIETWIDKSNLTAGQRWKNAIKNAIRSGAAFIACFSSESNGRLRSHMREELIIAIDEIRLRPHNSTWFIPVLLNECEVPDIEIRPGETLQDIQHVNLYDNWDDGLRRILQAISSLPGQSLDFTKIERIDKLLKSLQELRKLTDILWDQELSEQTLNEYKRSLQDAMRQLWQSSEALESQHYDKLEILLSHSLDFRFGKEKLLTMRESINYLSPDDYENIQNQIKRNGTHYKLFIQVLTQIEELNKRDKSLIK